jgi:hypothetical protein
MKVTLHISILLAVLGLLLSACGSRALPPLAVGGSPTLVFVYTDN